MLWKLKQIILLRGGICSRDSSFSSARAMTTAHMSVTDQTDLGTTAPTRLRNIQRRFDLTYGLYNYPFLCFLALRVISVWGKNALWDNKWNMNNLVLRKLSAAKLHETITQGMLWINAHISNWELAFKQCGNMGLAFRWQDPMNEGVLHLLLATETTWTCKHSRSMIQTAY